MHSPADSSRARNKIPVWAWALLAIVVAVIFWGYGQAELLLEAVNLRYCG